ncbi:MFS transporter [Flavicella sediminum]|uniref:MFS transporter n=1 Tax=Flavicella sediminum TaxID=2585141 RepID=UPI00111D0A85|nr:MFS transporter [Flavicella sediminum]
MLKKGDKKLIGAWAFYDWANSVYSLVIGTAIFPIYYNSVTGGNDAIVQFLGMDFNNATLYSYALSFSFFMVVFLSPILSSVADYMGNKKRFMQFFCFLGSFSVMSLFFFNENTLWVGIVFMVLASIGFWGSLVFYNAYLTEVAYPEDHDRVSAKGFILGYSGSVLLLLINLMLQMFPEMFGIEDPTLPARISFLMVGIWWIGFAQYTFYYLPNNSFNRKPEKDFIFKGFRELRKVVRELKEQRELKIFLTSFFLYSVGVQTIILIAALFGDKELHLETEKLIITILLIQLIAIVGAYVFSRLSKKIGNINTLKITIFGWGLITVGAYMLNKDNPNVTYQFYALGGFLGLVLGAIQSISRSTYSKLLPENTVDNTTYFSFYDVTEKIAIVLGTFISGFVIALTGSMKISVLILAVFFFAGFVVLSFIKKTKYVS